MPQILSHQEIITKLTKLALEPFSTNIKEWQTKEKELLEALYGNEGKKGKVERKLSTHVR